MVAGMQDDDIPGLIGDIIRLGTIEAVSLGAASATVRSGDVVSPPLPWLEMAGAFRAWTPPTVGEQVLILSPEGDIAGAVILRGLNCAAFPAPASDENPAIHGPDGLVIRLTGDGIEIMAPGGVTIEGPVDITGDVSVTGTITATEDVIADGISLKSHTHSGVQSGGSSTGGPQ